jgi:gas vesicle protein
MSKNAKKVAVGAAVGAAVGVVAGVLFAPKSGKETREDLKNGTKKAVKLADKKLHTAHEELSKYVDRAEKVAKDTGDKVKTEAHDALVRAKKARDQAATVLAAVRSGNSNDEDLDIALKNAKSALDSLKKYFKK